MKHKTIHDEVFAYGFPLYMMDNIQIDKILKEIYHKRKYHRIGEDSIKNDCCPIIDDDRRMILTGCHKTATLLQELSGIKPVLVIYPIWGYIIYKVLLKPHLFETCFRKGGFIFLFFKLY